MDEYFTSGSHKMQITRPFEIINQATDYDVRCSVAGGGHTGQAGAMVHGIAKALIYLIQRIEQYLRLKNLIPEILDQLREKNLVVEKLEEASNSRKDNSFLTLNCYNKKCLSLMF